MVPSDAENCKWADARARGKVSFFTHLKLLTGAGQKENLDYPQEVARD